MSYIVYARKWRPQTFDDIVGQEHVTTTLKNAIKQDRVAHAYMFSGPRGVGKTTTARILAKALNCGKNPTPSPCNKCDSCKDITEGKSLDIIEIDGASNRGIDEIRNLKENIKFSPQQARLKIYIIDEVHMLTPEAFNALLKTLEEPPQHVKFIFATTAIHKVLPTILSRCQRFNFRRISSKDIADKIRSIAKKEKISIEDEALLTIVRSASGSMRDAESLLDQMASFCKNKITTKDTDLVLGVIGQDRVFELAQYIVNKDAAGAIKFINKIIDEGIDPEQFLLSLIEYFRSILIIKEAKALAGSLDLTKDEIKRRTQQAQSLVAADIMYILYSLVNTNYTMRSSPSPKIALELLAVKLSQKESMVSLDEIMQRLSALEKEIASKIKNGSAFSKITYPKQEINPKNNNVAPQKIVEDSSKDDQDIPLPAEEISSSPESQTMMYKIKDAIPQVIKSIKQEKIYIASCLSEGKLVGFRNNTIIIGFPKNNTFHKESLEKAQNKKIIEEHFFNATNMRVSVEFVIKDGEENASSPDESSGVDQDKAPKSTLKKVLAEPIIKSALDIFDGNVMKFF
ncbi:DNA polymerase III subunit gamma/tau [Candidatus Omnitrophota bacterium]